MRGGEEDVMGMQRGIGRIRAYRGRAGRRGGLGVGGLMGYVFGGHLDALRGCFIARGLGLAVYSAFLRLHGNGSGGVALRRAFVDWGSEV